MKKIFCLIVVGFCLVGCLQAGDVYLCDECYTSVEKRDNTIQKMKKKYPINEQLLDTMNDNEQYIVRAHTRKYDGALFGSENMLANIILLPITLPLSVFYIIGLPVSYDYGMTLENQEGNTVFVPYSSLLQEYPQEGVKKKYDLITPSEYIKNQEAKKLQQQEQQKRMAIQKETEARQKQEKQKLEQERHEDCIQAAKKANDKRKYFYTQWKEWRAIEGSVFDFPAGGLLLDVGGLFNTEIIYVSTSDTDYATDEHWSSKGVIYRRNGNYRYTTNIGGTLAVPIYTPTSHKISEVDYKTYLQDKNHKCNYKETETGN